MPTQDLRRCSARCKTVDDIELLRIVKNQHGVVHRVEVLLRQQAFKPKTNGVKASSSLRQHFVLLACTWPELGRCPA